MPGSRILSDEQLERMAEWREAGRSYAWISQRFAAAGTAIHAKTIRWQCLNAGAFPPNHRPSNLGIKAGGQGRAFTPAEDEQLLKFEAEGLTKAEIGRRLNRKPNSIKGRLMTLAMHEELMS